jgi:3-hydroxyacyl-CoA dehydrogenase
MVDALEVRRVGVIGAGVMGAAIAAHVANAGIPVLLLDLPPDARTPEEEAAGLELGHPKLRNRRAIAGIRRVLADSPAGFFVPSCAALVTPGNLDDDLARLSEVDWVVEAVIEDPDVKADLLPRLAAAMAPGAVLSTNTSGLSCARLAACLPPEQRRRFFVTHFFNPPRYLHLLELVAAPETEPGLLERFAAFAERDLGKGCVIAKDTPDFIANRIGTFAFLDVLGALAAGRGDVATLDRLTGPLIGRPKSASFRTADLVGLDTLLHVGRHLHAALVDDPERDRFRPPELLERLVAEGRLGAKSGAGFYRKQGREILMLDPRTLDYVSQPKADPRAAGAVREPDVGRRLAGLIASDGPLAAPLWQHLSSVLCYAANCVPEISDDLVSVDRALRWGFGWALGPFETWDALGVEACARRLVAEGRSVPPVVQALLDSGQTRFHGVRSPDVAEDVAEDGTAGPMRTVFDPTTGRAVTVPPRPRVLEPALQRPGSVLLENAEATLQDLGQDVLYLELHGRMNVLGMGAAELLQRSVEETAARACGLVIGGRGEQFSAGANLKLLLAAIEAGKSEEVERLVALFQTINQGLARSPRPVVVACHGLTLGGGCEILLHAARVCAAAESYIGLVEAGAGLIPGAGGCKELVRRLDDSLPADLETDLLPWVQRLFTTVAMGRVSTSAAHARELGFLGPADRIVMNGEHLLYVARRTVRELAEDGWRPAPPRDDIRVLGEAGMAALGVGLWNMGEGGAISEHDQRVANALARVVCGGPVPIGTRVSEQRLLDLEREAFVSLCGEPKTQARMKALLETGKPLRN